MAKFRSSVPRLSLGKLQQIPRTPEGDRQLLDCLIAAISISSAIASFLKGELAHRPSIYEDLTRLLWRAEAR